MDAKFSCLDDSRLNKHGRGKVNCIGWDGLCRPIIVLSSYLGIATELVRKESYERRRKEDCERQDGVHHSDVLHGNTDVLKTVWTENYVNESIIFKLQIYT